VRGRRGERVGCEGRHYLSGRRSAGSSVGGNAHASFAGLFLDDLLGGGSGGGDWGADHDTPAPAGSAWFVTKRRSEWLLLWTWVLLLSSSLIALTLPALEMADGGDDKKENPDVDGDGNVDGSVGMELR